MPAGQKFPWILDWRGLPGRAPGAAEVLSLVFCWRPPVCAGGVLAEKGKPSLAEVLSLASEFSAHPSRRFAHLLPGTAAQHEYNNAYSAFSKLQNPPGASLGADVSTETQLRTITTSTAFAYPRGCMNAKRGFHLKLMPLGAP